jgi:hypothetical protein
MRGMGHLLSMYGGAGEEVETAYNEKRAAFLQAQAEYSNEKDKMRREKLRKIMENAKQSMDNAKEKMKALLKGVSDAASKAAVHLSASTKVVGAKLSSGAKAVGAKSVGSKLSSSVKSVGSKISTKDHNEINDRKKLLKLTEKYGSPASSISSISSI